MEPHEHAHEDDDSHKEHPAPSSQGESCPAGKLGSRNFMLILLTVLSMAFGFTMMQKYRALEAKLSAMGLEVGEDGTLQAAQNTNPKAEEHAKALDQIGHKLGALKFNMDEIEHLLKEQGVEVEAKKAVGPHEVQ